MIAEVLHFADQPDTELVSLLHDNRKFDGGIRHGKFFIRGCAPDPLSSRTRGEMKREKEKKVKGKAIPGHNESLRHRPCSQAAGSPDSSPTNRPEALSPRSEEHTSELRH